jgi:hypothetical protein
MNFETYAGYVTEGSAASPNFNEDFGSTGSSPVTYNTNGCPVQTELFSARYRLRKVFTNGSYTLAVGGDDGFRLSLDGGNTWPIYSWQDGLYSSENLTATLNGSYDIVFEYYNHTGYKRAAFAMAAAGGVLPVTLTTWSATALPNDQSLLRWQCTNAVNFDHFVIQRSTDGSNFHNVQSIPAINGNGSSLQNYSYTDNFVLSDVLYYRLMMVDQDGKSSYSTVAVIHRTRDQTISIYPTIIENGSLLLRSDQAISQAMVELFDMNGRRMLQKSWPVLQGTQQLSLPAGSGRGLSSGPYCVLLSSNHKILSRQIIIIKN